MRNRTRSPLPSLSARSRLRRNAAWICPAKSASNSALPKPRTESVSADVVATSRRTDRDLSRASSTPRNWCSSASASKGKRSVPFASPAGDVTTLTGYSGAVPLAMRNSKSRYSTGPLRFSVLGSRWPVLGGRRPGFGALGPRSRLAPRPARTGSTRWSAETVLRTVLKCPTSVSRRFRLPIGYTSVPTRASAPHSRCYPPRRENFDDPDETRPPEDGHRRRGRPWPDNRPQPCAGARTSGEDPGAGDGDARGEGRQAPAHPDPGRHRLHRPHQVRYALARGHKLTLFNRGPAAEGVAGRGRGARGRPQHAATSKALEGREWDVCIDNPTTLPAWVRDAAQVLKGKVGQYVFISTLSVYANEREGWRGRDARRPREYKGADAMKETHRRRCARNIEGSTARSRPSPRRKPRSGSRA